MSRIAPDVLTVKESGMLELYRQWRLATDEGRNGPKVWAAKGVTDPLGRWLNDQRARYRAGTIRPVVLDGLQRLGYDFAVPNDGPAKPFLSGTPPVHCDRLEVLNGFRRSSGPSSNR
ncbi:hypothetical protein AB4090_05065 [Acidithiobacillus sp. IBUN Pt1247-S3]|uniref:hypothetical protein n=1 Tax=Acidithiobacillus sp. IBUN Pt1247-S3 TaxID=3166642 RepID=UPI0034E5A782